MDRKPLKLIALILTIILAMKAATLEALPGGSSQSLTADKSGSEQSRRQYLEKLLEILPEVPSWNQWLQMSGEFPPDFDALPRINGLPDPLQFYDGRPVKTRRDWQQRRAEIRELFEKYAFGPIPPRPKIQKADVEETKAEGYRTRNVVLHLGPEGQVTFSFSMMIPDGDGPFPVLMGPGMVNTSVLLRRGYIGVSYPGSDFNDGTKTLIEQLYPQYDIAALPRRAWGATIVLDYLESVPEVDMNGIGIYGYSRDGKQVTIAGAIDERIDVVLAGSTGVGGTLPYRLAGERNMAESIESTTRMFPDWFHPRLRFFSGREDRLPIDGNLLVAMIAPRACLIHYNLNDEVGNTYGNEEGYRSAGRAYEFLGVPEKVGILRQPGFHSSGMDIEAGLDWMDIQIGRSQAKWINDELFTWNYEQWLARSGESVDLNKYPDKSGSDILSSTDGKIGTQAQWQTKAGRIRDNVKWMLGDEPPMMQPGNRRGGFRRGGGFGMRGGRTGPNPGQIAPIVDEWVIARNSQEFGWREPDRSRVTSRPVSFGYNVSGKIYTSAETPEDAKLPAVIWLHSYSYPLGYMWVYRRDVHPVIALAKQGYAVLAFDQSGFGSRMNETKTFYYRYPHWSRIGRMVEDVRQAVTMLEQDSQIDPDRIYLFGYSLGGMVGLHAAALDERINGVVSISGFTPMRTDTADKGTGGIARFSRDRGLMPRLGFFVGRESKIPYDYDELIAAIAPRPVLIIAPQLDRDGTPADVRRALEQARKVYALYDAADNLALQEPWDYTRLPTATQDLIIKWMDENLK
ncbi:MAG: alpha/beta fold hydrolase [Sedimentisphaerales bacterium]|nr:alpha/beta fold hydrolase [Sedimentisphaerales bacterium]